MSTRSWRQAVAAAVAAAAAWLHGNDDDDDEDDDRRRKTAEARDVRTRAGIIGVVVIRAIDSRLW